MRWSGKTAEGEDVAGRLIIPEVSHEVTVDGLSDYVVCLSHCCSSSPTITYDIWNIVGMVPHN